MNTHGGQNSRKNLAQAPAVVRQAFVSSFDQQSGHGTLCFPGKRGGKELLAFSLTDHRKMAAGKAGVPIFTDSAGMQFSWRNPERNTNFLPLPDRDCCVAVTASNTGPAIWAYWFEYARARRACTVCPEPKIEPIEESSQQALPEDHQVAVEPSGNEKPQNQKVRQPQQQPQPGQNHSSQPTNVYVPARHRGKDTPRPAVSSYRRRQRWETKNSRPEEQEVQRKALAGLNDAMDRSHRQAAA